MNAFIRRFAAVLVICFLAPRWAGAAEEPVRREWKVNEVAREALVYVPASARTNAAPVVFVFHGHGGNMRNSMRTFSIHTLWPEAIVVYPQGLNTPGRLTDPEGKKPGWQHGAGAQEDRDLKFFDVMLASLKADFKVDARRIYSTGHSNGGGFTYLLWAERGDQFAAFAPSAAAAGFLASDLVARAAELRQKRAPAVEAKAESKEADDAEKGSKKEKPASKLKPKPFMHLGAENDPLVKFEWQKGTYNRLKELNQCDEGKPWKGEKGATIYGSKVGAPVVIYFHEGGHKFPSEGPALIVKFFKDYAQP